MPSVASYSEALKSLASRRRLGMKLGLENMEALASALGQPHRRLRFVHIAGTNGKGSTAAFLASLLRAAGQRVGLFTSPHLLSVRERIVVDGTPISRAAFAEGIAAVAQAAEAGAERIEPTFFETLTALALRHFERERTDWVVWETGLGGRLDSTNIVTPAVAIITNIGSDHAQFLGTTPAEIAAEKAGIIKAGRPLVTAEDRAEPLAVLRRIAAERKAPLHLIGDTEGLPLLDLHGPHQRKNAASALAAFRLLGLGLGLGLGLPLPEAEIAKALAETTWPGRFETILAEPPLILDGGHNPEGIAAAVAAWREAFGPLPFRLVYGGMADKDHAAAARLLMPHAGEVLLVRAAGERAAEPETLLAHFPDATTFPSLAALWPRLIMDPAPTLLLGSLTLVGEALLLAGRHRFAPEEEESEAALNELLSPPVISVPG